MALLKSSSKVVKDLLICPYCEKNNEIKVLGELESNGTFKIIRFHKLYKGSTKIIGRDFAIICGTCNNSVYIRKLKG